MPPKPIRKRRLSGLREILPLLKDVKVAPSTGSRSGVPDRREKKRLREVAKKQKAAELIKQRESSWTPAAGAQEGSNPDCTVIVARLSYDTTPQRLRRFMEEFGPVASVKFVYDTHAVIGRPTVGRVPEPDGDERPMEEEEDEEGDAMPRGYAFVEFDDPSAALAAMYDGTGYVLDGRPLIVDMERSRRDPEWRPRSLGGGLGETRSSSPTLLRKAAARRARIRGDGVGGDGRDSGRPARGRVGVGGGAGMGPSGGGERGERGGYGAPRAGPYPGDRRGDFRGGDRGGRFDGRRGGGGGGGRDWSPLRGEGGGSGLKRDRDWGRGDNGYGRGGGYGRDHHSSNAYPMEPSDGPDYPVEDDWQPLQRPTKRRR